jgi:hypothetical protein
LPEINMVRVEPDWAARLLARSAGFCWLIRPCPLGGMDGSRPRNTEVFADAGGASPGLAATNSMRDYLRPVKAGPSVLTQNSIGSPERGNDTTSVAQRPCIIHRDSTLVMPTNHSSDCNISTLITSLRRAEDAGAGSACL